MRAHSDPRRGCETRTITRERRCAEKQSTAIRYVLEEWLPPSLRDSAFMRLAVPTVLGLVHRRPGALPRAASPRLVRGRVHERFMSACRASRTKPTIPRRVSRRLQRASHPGRVCDVGCGTGYLLDHLRQQLGAGRPRIDRRGLHHRAARRAAPSCRSASSPRRSRQLPFPDRHFDTVICTHVLEHILDIRAAIHELRRICARRLIVVVPLEREYRFTFNPHVHFFPYPHSFLRHIIPVPRHPRHRRRSDVICCMSRSAAERAAVIRSRAS